MYGNKKVSSGLILIRLQDDRINGVEDGKIFFAIEDETLMKLSLVYLDFWINSPLNLNILCKLVLKKVKVNDYYHY